MLLPTGNDVQVCTEHTIGKCKCVEIPCMYGGSKKSHSRVLLFLQTYFS